MTSSREDDDVSSRTATAAGPFAPFTSSSISCVRIRKSAVSLPEKKAERARHVKMMVSDRKTDMGAPYATEAPAAARTGSSAEAKSLCG